MALGREVARGLVKLVVDLAADLNDGVEEEKRHGWGELRGRAGGLDEGEDVGEEGGPLRGVDAQEEESEDLGDFVAQDCDLVSMERGEMKE